MCCIVADGIATFFSLVVTDVIVTVVIGSYLGVIMADVFANVVN